MSGKGRIKKGNKASRIHTRLVLICQNEKAGKGTPKIRSPLASISPHTKPALVV